MDCKLNITAGFNGVKSYMKDVFVSSPFRVLPVGQTKSDKAAYPMTVSSSSGILDGDHYNIDIKVEENARLQLQSCQRLFNIDGEASQIMHINLHKNAALAYIAHPIVPHTNSTFKSITKVKMGKGCTFLMSEIITCGRKHQGKSLRFGHFQSLLEVRYQNRLILKDNFLLHPELMSLASIGQLENFTHQGTLIQINTKNQPVEGLIEHIYEMMCTEEELQFGISKIQYDGFVLRCMGNGAEQIYDCLQRIQNFIWGEISITPI